jgi:hypothetical protein
MIIENFSYFDCNDDVDVRFIDEYSWSRPYEYHFVLQELSKFENNDILIHNSCWGYMGVHITFKNILEKEYINVLNSDIQKSELPNTFVYDITKDNPVFHGKFDCIINVSTLEEIKNVPHVEILKNQIKQLKSGGKLIITFDLNDSRGLDLNAVELFLNRKITQVATPLNGSTSKYKNLRYSHLKCGYLTIKK